MNNCFLYNEYLYYCQSLDFPVDISERSNFVESGVVVNMLRNKKMEVKDQEDHAQENYQDSGIEVEESYQELRIAEAEMRKSKMPLLKTQFVFCVYSNDKEELENRVSLLIDHYKDTHLPQLQRKFKKIDIDKITPLEYEKFLLSLRKRGYKKGYVSAINTVMKMIMNFAVKHGFLEQNKLLFIQLPKFRKSIEELKNSIEAKYLTIEELEKILKLSEKESSYMLSTLFYLLAYTGIRIGEALALEFSDFNYEKKEVHIYKTLYQVGNGTRNYEVTTPKSENSARKIQVSDEVIERIQSLQKNIYELRQKNKFEEKRDFCFVFLKNKSYGLPLTLQVINDEIRKNLLKTGINKKITSHKFRHTHVSLLAQAGVPLPVIQERIGHGDKRVTEEIYLHITSDLKIEAVEKLDVLLKQNTEKGVKKGSKATDV